MEFHKLWIICLAKIFSSALLFPILKIKFLMAQIVIKNFEQEIFVFETTIFEDFLLECKILNSRVVENIFPEKLNCDL